VFYWIYDYPTWSMGALFAAVFVTVTWLGIFVLRPTVVSWIHSKRPANDIVGVALSSFSVPFGLLLGLLAVASYQNFSTVSDLVDREASCLAALHRDFTGYPEPVRAQLQDRLREYVRFTIEEAWPQQRRGIVPEGGSQRINAIFDTLSGFEPASRGQEVLHAEALRQFTLLVETRRSRLANVTTGLPAVLWWIVTFGALVNITLIWLLDAEISVHMIVGGVLAAFLGVVIFLIAALDNPFRGELSVGPDSIAAVYDNWTKMH